MQLDIQTHLPLQIQLNVFSSACPSACLPTSLKTIAPSFARGQRKQHPWVTGWGTGEAAARNQILLGGAAIPWQCKEELLDSRAAPPVPAVQGWAEFSAVVLRTAPNVIWEEPASSVLCCQWLKGSSRHTPRNSVIACIFSRAIHRQGGEEEGFAECLSLTHRRGSCSHFY